MLIYLNNPKIIMSFNKKNDKTFIIYSNKCQYVTCLKINFFMNIY